MLVVKRDPAEQLGLLRLGQLAALHGPAGRVLEVLAAALEGLVVDLHAGHGEAVAGEHLGDAGAHRAEPDHADRGEVAGLLPGVLVMAGSSHARFCDRVSDAVTRHW